MSKNDGCVTIGGHRTGETRDDIEHARVQCRTRQAAAPRIVRVRRRVVMDSNGSYIYSTKTGEASAVQIVRVGSHAVMDSNGSYNYTKKTGECMEFATQDGTFVCEVQLEDGQAGAITVNSGAGVHDCWTCRIPRSVPA